MCGIVLKCFSRILLYLLVITVWSSCQSARYFATPDYFTKEPGVLILKSGEQIRGDISVNNTMGNSVSVKSYPGGKKQSFQVKEVEACHLEIGVFEPMSIGREVTKLYTLPVFMERLTPDSFSISLYEGYQKLTDPNLMGDVSIQPGVEYDLEYFVHLPYDDPQVVWQLSTAVLSDHLRIGLDSLLRQCPGLAEKTRSGDPAYDIYFSPKINMTEHWVLGRLSTSAKKEKVKNIIRVLGEYDRCRSR